jgi:hypothetical protein
MHLKTRERLEPARPQDGHVVNRLSVVGFDDARCCCLLPRQIYTGSNLPKPSASASPPSATARAGSGHACPGEGDAPPPGEGGPSPGASGGARVLGAVVGRGRPRRGAGRGRGERAGVGAGLASRPRSPSPAPVAGELATGQPLPTRCLG